MEENKSGMESATGTMKMVFSLSVYMIPICKYYIIIPQKLNLSLLILLLYYWSFMPLRTQMAGGNKIYNVIVDRKQIDIFLKAHPRLVL
jgi:hypothetical protein